jgi:hypothetical protein
VNLPRKTGDGELVADRAHTFFQLPAQFDEAVAHAEVNAHRDVYFTPAAYSQEFRKGDDPNAVCRCAYADADTFHPDGFRLKPTIAVESSMGRWQCFWLLDGVVSQDVVSRLSMKIGRAHNLDASSGIATKLLRVPLTTNTKYDWPHEVEIAWSDGPTYTVEQVEQAYADTILGPSLSRAEMDMPTDLPELFDVLAKIPATNRIEWLMEWDKKTASDPDKRSEHRFELIRLLLEAGLTPPEVLVAVWSCPVSNHFVEQGRGIDHLWSFDVLAALAKEEPTPELVEYEPQGFTGLSFVDEVETGEVFGTPGFMERWVALNYENLHPKTPSQYVRINGYILLAAAMGHKVAVIPPGSQRSVFCNLNVLNLGPTTSGKSEALFFLKRYIEAFQLTQEKPIIVGSNATAEGLVKVLKDYNRMSAMLVTEEVAGKFKQWQNSSTMAHAREVETEIYDNYLPMNLRAGDNSNTEKVHLAFSNYMLGVDSEVEKILDRGFLRSGYLPRCLVVKAERLPFDEVESMSTPQGDPERTQDADLKPGMWAKHFETVLGHHGRIEKHGRTVMMFTDEAWERFLKFRTGLLKWADDHEDADLIRPMAIRFVVSCQKMMALLAYERLAPVVELIDVLHVLHDAEEFWGYTLSLVQGVSDSDYARLQEEVIAWLVAHDKKARVSEFHNRFQSISVRERLDILDSLERRGIVAASRNKSVAVLEMA